MGWRMKLAASTIYSDNDLTMPITLNSIITAKFVPNGLSSFFVLTNEGWSRDLGIIKNLEILLNIVIIYRAPEEGQGPELIQPLEDIYLEATLTKVEFFFKRFSDKVDGIRAVLEAE